MKEIFYQEYIVRLMNGMSVTVAEEYEKPFKDGLIEHYSKADDNYLFAFGDRIGGFTYVLKKNIAAISTGEVRKGEKFEWKLK